MLLARLVHVVQAQQAGQQLAATRDALDAEGAQLAQALASIAAMQDAQLVKDRLLQDMRDAIEEAEQGVPAFAPRRKQEHAH